MTALWLTAVLILTATNKRYVIANASKLQPYPNVMDLEDKVATHKVPTLALVGALMALAICSTAAAQSLSGVATAGDGDSLTVAGRKVRLLGIDAPELDQTCSKEGQIWPCGQTAKEHLASLIAGQTVSCQGQGVDQFRRILAVCNAGGENLNETMVEYGWAVAFRRYSDAYVMAESRAKAHGLGIWSSQFIPPSEYRRSKLSPQTDTGEPAGLPKHSQSKDGSGRCSIKGNRNRRGEWIYHLPGMPYYDRTRPEEMFCSEAQAQAAGYRRAIVRP